jgi:hypothetical protein
MPFYQITITLKTGETITGIREHPNGHIDPVYMEYFIKANQHYHHENIVDFNCMMISRHCQLYRNYEAGIRKPEMMDREYKETAAFKTDQADGPGKYKHKKT